MAKVATRVQTGDVINMVADSGDVRVGDAFPFGDRVGVASTDAAQDETFALQIEGVFRFTGKTTDNMTPGMKLYFDAATNEATVTDTGNKVIGYATTYKASAAPGTVDIKLGN